jgi:hypothetical protein
MAGTPVATSRSTTLVTAGVVASTGNFSTGAAGKGSRARACDV